MPEEGCGAARGRSRRQSSASASAHDARDAVGRGDSDVLASLTVILQAASHADDVAGGEASSRGGDQFDQARIAKLNGDQRFDWAGAADEQGEAARSAGDALDSPDCNKAVLVHKFFLCCYVLLVWHNNAFMKIETWITPILQALGRS